MFQQIEEHQEPKPYPKRDGFAITLVECGCLKEKPYYLICGKIEVYLIQNKIIRSTVYSGWFY